METTTAQQIANLEKAAAALRQLERNAFNMRNASQVGRIQKDLETIYHKIDTLRKNEK